MFKKENGGFFARGPFGTGTEKKAVTMVKPVAPFGRDTGFRDVVKLGGSGEKAIPPFVRNLQDLASYSGIVERFHSSIIEYTTGKSLDPETKNLLELGKAYHGRGLRKALEGLTKEDGVDVRVAVPVVQKVANGKRRVVPGISGDSRHGRLFAIVGARRNQAEEVIFEAVAVLDGDPVDRKHAVLVGIHSQSGKVFFHPDFLPVTRHKHKVDHVLPPIVAHRLFPQGRTLDPKKAPVQFFK